MAHAGAVTRTWLQSLSDLVVDGVIDPEGEPCCVLTARLIAKHAGLSDHLYPGTKWWEDANVWDPSDPFSSVRAAAEVCSRVKSSPSSYAILRFEDGLTWKRIEHHLHNKRWYFVQGWHEDDTGHAWIMHVSEYAMADVLIESGKTYGLRVNVCAWDPEDGDRLAPSVNLQHRLLQFQAGIGLAELW